MSGGVDSSIAAYLTMQTGCPCLGATMRLYRNVDIGKSPQRTCCAQKDIDDASQVAFQLDLPYEVLDLTARFRAEVMDKFVRTYEAGGTPNPCIDCNRSLKFDTLLALARETGPAGPHPVPPALQGQDPLSPAGGMGHRDAPVGRKDTSNV